MGEGKFGSSRTSTVPNEHPVTMSGRLNQKDLRIIKLHEKGMDEARIAQKIGYSGENIGEGVARVKDALKRAGRYEIQTTTGIDR